MSQGLSPAGPKSDVALSSGLGLSFERPEPTKAQFRPGISLSVRLGCVSRDFECTVLTYLQDAQVLFWPNASNSTCPIYFIIKTYHAFSYHLPT